MDQSAERSPRRTCVKSKCSVVPSNVAGHQMVHFVRNDDVRRQTKQLKLTVIIQARRLTLFGHIAHMDDNVDDKRILCASPQGTEEDHQDAPASHG